MARPTRFNNHLDIVKKLADVTPSLRKFKRRKTLKRHEKAFIKRVANEFNKFEVDGFGKTGVKATAAQIRSYKKHNKDSVLHPRFNMLPISSPGITKIKVVKGKIIEFDPRGAQRGINYIEIIFENYTQEIKETPLDQLPFVIDDLAIDAAREIISDLVEDEAFKSPGLNKDFASQIKANPGYVELFASRPGVDFRIWNAGTSFTLPGNGDLLETLTDALSQVSQYGNHDAWLRGIIEVWR